MIVTFGERGNIINVQNATCGRWTSNFRRNKILHWLVSNGYLHMWEATNGLEAIELIDEQRPDILCDIRMPKMDGISLINYIQPRYPNIKVIFLSAYPTKNFLKVQSI